MIMKTIMSKHSCLIRGFYTGLGIALLTSVPAYAQNVASVTDTIMNQFAAAPTVFKNISILSGALAAMAGISGFYKGLGDPRSAAPLKNGFLVLIGSLFLAMSYIALSAEKSVFGDNGKDPKIQGRSAVTKQLEAFK